MELGDVLPGSNQVLLKSEDLVLAELESLAGLLVVETLPIQFGAETQGSEHLRKPL